jgi:hypothetical protein
MKTPVLDPPVADVAPVDALLRDDVSAALLDAVADVDRCVAGMLAIRARLIDEARDWMEAAAA